MAPHRSSHRAHNSTNQRHSGRSTHSRPAASRDLSVASPESALAVPSNHNGVALWPSDFNLNADIDRGRLTRHRDGSYAMDFVTNADRTVCAYCHQSFRNQKKLREHHKSNTHRCMACRVPRLWCSVGSSASGNMTCSPFSCSEHGKCFGSHQAALQHAMKKEHTRCFFPRCTGGMAIGPRNVVVVGQHMWDAHWYDPGTSTDTCGHE